MRWAHATITVHPGWKWSHCEEFIENVVSVDIQSAWQGHNFIALLNILKTTNYDEWRQLLPSDFLYLTIDRFIILRSSVCGKTTAVKLSKRKLLLSNTGSGGGSLLVRRQTVDLSPLLRCWTLLLPEFLLQVVVSTFPAQLALSFNGRYRGCVWYTWRRTASGH